MSRAALLLVAPLFALAACSDSDSPLATQRLDAIGGGAPMRWSEAAPMPIPVRAAAATAFGGRFYVLGGSDPTGQTRDAVQIFDPVANQWTIGPSFASKRDFPMSAALDDGVHLLGGIYANRFDHQLYSPDTNSWESLAPMPTGAWAASTEVVGQRIYVIGGLEATNAVQIYDSETDTWSFGAPMPTRRFSAASATHAGKIYVAGGQLTAFETSTALEVYDPAADTWTSLAPMPEPREALAGGMVAGQFCVFGGRLTNPGPTGDAFPDTYCYHPARDEWRHVTAMLTPRVEVAVARMNGRVWTFGGRTPSAMAVPAVEVLRP